MHDHACIPTTILELPPVALMAIKALEDGGYEAWCVGGLVRDAILGRAASDIDIATNAHWRESQRLFIEAGWRTHETGVKHGTLTVILEDQSLEITTYRQDGAYKDGRHPESVGFVNSIEEDLRRRDFTINALAYHPQRGFLDICDGLDDIREGVIRAVGNPEQRFAEDALRILRACRFQSQLGFRIEEQALCAMRRCKSELRRISAERVTHEIEGLLMGDHVHDAIVGTSDVLSFVLPELTAMQGFDQKTPYHIYDVLEHTAWVAQHTPPQRVVRWAALFHDMGKPAAAFEESNGIRHFYGHAYISMTLAAQVMERFLISPTLREKILLLVRHHDDVVEPTAKAVKRMLGKLGGDVGLFRALCDLKRADSLAQAPQYASRAEQAERLVLILEEILEAGEAFSVSHLAINGRDVLALGIEEGPEVGAMLTHALEGVVEKDIPNEREALLEYIRAARHQ